MAEIGSTPEGQLDGSWLDLDDAAIGKLVKQTARQLKGDPDTGAGQAAMWWWSAALLMVETTADASAKGLTKVLHGDGKDGQPMGDFRITIERVAGASVVGDRKMPAVKEGTAMPEHGREPGSRVPSSNLLDCAVRERLVHPHNPAVMQQAHRIVESALPEAVQFLFRRMRLMGIVPTFYAGEALYTATGAPTGGNVPDKALNSLAEDLQSQWGLAAESASGVVKGVARHLIDVDRLPEPAALMLAKGITQGDVMAQSSYL
ncbi:hypothetical protein [Chromobacterium haemolyticum]|uniref:hypothetical protein n=1 Tax=Chromobacterium haemolyticum TaxID=394935 RepID=UPI002447356F|nr:hypothetical protein [Chromobacterium haemolyticum]MDH0342039.1 hypothetical protein [Chromobacterium haemolyticum]